jgi:hypothetical protein
MNVKHPGLPCLALCLLAAAAPARAEQVTIQITSRASESGFFLAPVWVGFHDGSFDLFDAGSPIAAGGTLERLVEDGDPEPLQGAFAAAVPDGLGGFITAPGGFEDVPVFEPGEQGTLTFELDPVKHRYMSFAAMILPSNDAFIGNDDPRMIELFDASGHFKGMQVFSILGTDVWDAGTELNNEMNAAFLNQSEPDTGVTTSNPVTLHPGLIGSYANPAVGQTPIILGATLEPGITFDPVASDFTRPGTVVIDILCVPEPATVALLALGSLVLLRRRSRRCGV